VLRVQPRWAVAGHGPVPGRRRTGGARRRPRRAAARIGRRPLAVVCAAGYRRDLAHAAAGLGAPGAAAGHAPGCGPGRWRRRPLGPGRGGHPLRAPSAARSAAAGPVRPGQPYAPRPAGVAARFRGLGFPGLARPAAAAVLRTAGTRERPAHGGVAEVGERAAGRTVIDVAHAREPALPAACPEP